MPDQSENSNLNLGVESGDADLLNSPAHLHQAVELIVGMDGANLLYDSRTKQYTRLGVTAAKILRSVSEMPQETTVQNVVDALADQNEVSSEVVWGMVRPLFTSLDEDGALSLSAEPAKKDRRVKGFQLIRRVPLLQDPARGLAPLAKSIRAIPSWVLVGLTGLSLVAAVTSLVYSLPGLVTSGIDQSSFAAAAVALIFTTFLHEASHAVLLVRYGTPPREAGVGFLFGFLPIAYVDRSDSYRIVDRKRRVFVSLAGPSTDILLAGSAAFAAQFVTGSDHDLLNNLAIVLTIICFINLNPILPTDGAHALEAGTGQINVHSNAFGYIFGRILPNSRRPIRRNLSSRQTFLYITVVFLAMVWLILVVIMIVFTAYGLLRGA